MNKRFIVVLTAVFAVMSLFAGEVKLPTKESFHIFLLAGQSNMAGRGKVTDEDKLPHPRVLVLSKEGEWKPAVAPLHYDKGAAMHEIKLKELIERFRKELKSPGLPFIIGQLGQFEGKPWSQGRMMVDQAQRKVAKEVPSCAFVSSDDLTPNSDNVHFNADSLRVFGKRYADAYDKIKL